MAEHQQKQGVGPFSNPPNNPPLRLCPFCGEQEGLRATTGPVPNFWGVICDGCGCFLDCRANAESEAVALWNRRTEERPNHAYRVGVAVGRAFPQGHARAVPDGESDREGYWREQAEVYRQRMEAAEAALSTLSVHPSDGDRSREVLVRRAISERIASTHLSTLSPGHIAEICWQVIENIEPTSTEMRTRSTEQEGA